jgi:sugar lactone lactonase YvrE
LSAPNDIVFDRQGGFYFTDLGKRRARDRDHGGLYYALPDGSKITELVHPMLSPNGVGLSPDEKTVYVADTETSRLFAFDIVEPGVLRKEPFPAPYTGRLVCGLPGFQRFDSLAVEASGNIAVATLITGHRHRSQWQCRAAGQDARRLPDQHLLWRPRYEDGLHHLVRFRPARRDGLARARPAP